ncbi:MAG: VCBS repeat-containing protein [Ferruginibacter sp.]
MKYYAWCLFISFFIISCNNLHTKKESAGEQTAKKYCSSCHLFPEPGLLDKNSWKQNVLPPMGAMLGIDYLYQLPLDNFKGNAISPEDWNKIVNFYVSEAPAKMPEQGRPAVTEYTGLFSAIKIVPPQGHYPSTSYVKIDPGNHWIYAADAFDSTMNIYDAELNRVDEFKANGVVVDMYFKDPLSSPGGRHGIMTNIGIMNPNDLSVGTVDSFSISKKGLLVAHGRLFNGLPRPVQAIEFPTKENGENEYVVCGFGNKISGGLIKIKKTDTGKFEPQILRQLPGAIRAYIDDFNRDGLPDIMVLMAQAQEGIYLLLNKGNGQFETKEVLRFPAIYGSSYFELIDFNNDGFKDILYTCGDNADYTSGVLKNYHGIYIFLNDGHNSFSQKYFFPVNGCFKATARDFDKDGDLDIAAISYFPDVKNQPQESFIYLEQKKSFQFYATSIKEFNEGKWLTIDAGDIDGDGDDDIVLGGLVPPVPGQQEAWKKSDKQKSSLMLLRNKTYSK